MNLQDTFYLTYIILGAMGILLLIALVAMTFYTMRKLSQLADSVQQKLDLAGQVMENPGDLAAEVAASAGIALATSMVGQAKKLIRFR